MCAACRRAAGLLKQHLPSSSSSKSIFSHTNLINGKTDVFRSAAISGTSSMMQTRSHFTLRNNTKNEEEDQEAMKRITTRNFHSSSFAASGVSTHIQAEKKRFSAEAAATSTEEMVETDLTKKDETKMKKSAQSYMLAHPTYDFGFIEQLKPKHRPPQGTRDYVSMFAVWSARKGFDTITSYSHDKSLTKDEWLFRFIFLETVAGIPGMVAGMLRHMNSLRLLRHDNGWIHTLLEEAENERMHLMTFLNMKQPSIFFRAGVLAAQGVFFNAFFFSYLISPRTCHRFVGYLEEEAVRTYTHALNDIDSGGTDARQWAKERAPKLAIEYWKMDEDATIRDVLLAVRADEASHAHVNHTFSSMGTTQKNPFVKGESHLPENFVEPPPGFVPSEENRVAKDADSF
jgi:threonyl-tRNA synthetase